MGWIERLRRRTYVLIDLEGATVGEYRKPQEVRLTIRHEIDPHQLAVLIYENGKRVGAPIHGSRF